MRQDLIDHLSPREREVGALVARGFRNEDIAAFLGIAPNTAMIHTRRIFDVLGVASLAELRILLTGGQEVEGRIANLRQERAKRANLRSMKMAEPTSAMRTRRSGPTPEQVQRNIRAFLSRPPA